jgi:hypothetical protein
LEQSFNGKKKRKDPIQHKVLLIAKGLFLLSVRATSMIRMQRNHNVLVQRKVNKSSPPPLLEENKGVEAIGAMR